MCDYINYKFYMSLFVFFFFFSSRRRHTRFDCDWSSDVCSSDLDGDCATGSDIQVMLAGHGDFITRWIAITFAGDGRETASHGVPSLSSCQSLRLWSLTAPRLRREYQVATRVELQRQQTVVEKGIERCRHAHGVPEAHDGPCMRLEV